MKVQIGCAGNVKKVLETFTFDQIFGRKEIKSALHYGDYRVGGSNPLGDGQRGMISRNREIIPFFIGNV